MSEIKISSVSIPILQELIIEELNKYGNYENVEVSALEKIIGIKNYIEKHVDIAVSVTIGNENYYRHRRIYVPFKMKKIEIFKNEIETLVRNIIEMIRSEKE